ncbi:MAG: DUF1974 domain-containing protein [Shewanella sp.]|nr:DUF1974 domain-containing protein [Shewanella sp.]
MYQTRALRCRVDTAVRKGELKVAADQCRFDAAQAAGIIDEEGCAALKEADSLRSNAIAVDGFETLKA